MKTGNIPLPLRMIIDRIVLLVSAVYPITNDWNPDAYMKSLISQGVIQESKIVKSEKAPFARIIARVTYKKAQAIFKMHTAYRFTSHLVQVSNELNTLGLLNTHTAPKSTVLFPKIFRTHTDSSEVYGIREYFSGTQLVTHASKMAEAYDACISAFASISSRLTKKETASLPKRTPMSMVLTFPIVAMIAICKNADLRKDIAFLILQFARHLSLRDMVNPTYVIAHRDLSPENILVMKNAYGVIDAEVAALCEKGTDLSLFPRFYYRYISKDQIRTVLDKHIRTRRDRAAFIRLTIYYTLHYLAVCAKNDAYYAEAREYIHVFRTSIYPMIDRPGGSVYEKTLSFLLTLPLRIGFRRSLFVPAKDFILCYHSISEGGERYKTSPERFKQQLAFLRSHTSIVPLSTMLTGYPKSKKTRVSLTFDDGYRDTYTVAFPMLSLHNLTATVFIIGQTMKDGMRRHTYLDNELMTLDEIKKLHIRGWEIGFHTQSHMDLRVATNSQIQKELSGSKKRIEEHIGAVLRYIAYPFGGYTKEVRKALPLSGFEAGFTTDSGSIVHSDLTAIPRVDVEGALTETEFSMLCSPYGLWISGLLMRMLTGKIYIEQYLSHVGRT